jgi:hypothetical protein
MNTNDQPRLAEMLEEVCAIYSKPYTEVLVHAYYRVLRTYSFEAISKAMLRILGDENRRQVMPTAAEIKAIAKHMESAGGEQAYLRCQWQGCQALVAWPPSAEVTEASYYCPRHKPLHEAEWDGDTHYANRVTAEEKAAILAQASPGAKALIRSVVPALMADIPITEEERLAAERLDAPRRAVAFAETATGPGVNPRVFLTQSMGADLHPEYIERRHLVRVEGWIYTPEDGYWHRGRRVLTDEQIDGFPDKDLLADFLGRRGTRGG